MIKEVKITNYLGDELVMDLTRPEESGFAITKIDGIGADEAKVNITEVATMDGGVYNSSRMDSRNIVFHLRFWGLELEDDPVNSYSVEYIRQLSYKYFPIKRKVTICITNDNRACEIVGYVEKNEPDVFSKEENAQISIVCPNPFFHDAHRIDEVTLFGVEPLFEFPFSNEDPWEPLLEMGEIKNKFFADIYYSGDDEVGIIMRLIALGRIENVRIYNILTREKMTIDTDRIAAQTGGGIANGDEIEICTEKGNKYAKLIRNGRETNILNCIARESDWFQLARGFNQFGFTADVGRTNLQFKIRNRILYEGV